MQHSNEPQGQSADSAKTIADTLSRIFPDVPPFWRDQPLSSSERLLIGTVLAIQPRLAERDDIARRVIRGVACANGRNLEQSLAAGLMSIGGQQAPIALAMGFLAVADASANVQHICDTRRRVPGWGNSLVKGESDPELEPLREVLADHFHWMLDRIENITHILQANGRNVFPNCAAYIAAVNIIVGLPENMAAYYYITGRLSEWARLVFDHRA